MVLLGQKPQTKITRTHLCRRPSDYFHFFRLFFGKTGPNLENFGLKGSQIDFSAGILGGSHASCLWVNDHFQYFFLVQNTTNHTGGRICLAFG